MKRVHSRLAFGVIFMAYLDLVAFVNFISDVKFFREDNLIIIGIIGIIIALITSKKLSKNYASFDNNDFYFGIILAILGLIFIVIACVGKS